MSRASPTSSWCDKDQHHFFDHYADFNAWLEESDDAQSLRDDLGLDNLSQPAKALFAGDKAQYDQAFEQYKINRRQELLSRDYLHPLTGDEHWFERNVEHFEQLLLQLAKGNVLPFVGAGVSVGGRFPTWQNHLRQQGKTANIPSEHIEALLTAGEFETIIAEIEAKRGRDVFVAEIRDVFGKSGTVPDAVWRLTELFGDTVLTTNYDRLLEQAFGAGQEDRIQIINALMRSEQPDAKRTTLVKLHGDITKPGKCILSKNQYDDAYGAESLDLSLPIPKLLSHYYQSTSLLFLGCSLNNDRTVQVFRAVRQQAGDAEFPQHFSFEQACDNPETMAERNAMLESLGITAIWFEKDRFDLVERLLELARDELNHRRSLEPNLRGVKTVEEPEPENLQLDAFMRDFADLMPLLYWLHQTVPRSETSKYLLAMQQVFYAWSIFTETTDRSLVAGLDLLLRALSNNPNFDSYAHGKLSGAFRLFQYYLGNLGEKNYATEKYDWNNREMMVIPAGQFESMLSGKTSLPKPDYHAIRLILALLKHGQRQLHSPQQFCELPPAVNIELGDYLGLALSTKLNLATPDRLDDMLTGDINSLCQNAWDNFNKPMEIGWLDKVKRRLFGKLG
ncbi:SIR2 family NAD-dependent protein deacylase [Methylomonas koyamae]|uniref:SIR2 family NAD-dependent protein deacylase n=1 Tax=Methylomonas koyamae TaxID=702114 RepID=UPI002872FD9A|nr:SIR2 family protein [Methylomonas koyamae]WNB74178.1 SIR2 family protein [Methylomonas koyamae]